MKIQIVEASDATCIGINVFAGWIEINLPYRMIVIWSEKAFRTTFAGILPIDKGGLILRSQ